MKKFSLLASVLGFAVLAALPAAAYDPMPDPRMPQSGAASAQTRNGSGDGIAEEFRLTTPSRARAEKHPKFGETDRSRKRETTYSGSFQRDRPR